MKLNSSEPDLKTIVERIENGDIDLQPDFQRNEVWSRAKQRKLIDTILRGWSIAPVHLVITADGRAEVLDGQQRLATPPDLPDEDEPGEGSETTKAEAVKSPSGE